MDLDLSGESGWMLESVATNCLKRAHSLSIVPIQESDKWFITLNRIEFVIIFHLPNLGIIFRQKY